MGKTTKTLIIFMIILICSAKIHAADLEGYSSGDQQPLTEITTVPISEEVTLHADRVSFNDETGRAYAQGNAVLTYQGTTIMAERIEYDAASQKVQAMPLPGGQILLTNADRSIKGDQLEYDLNTKEGILSGAVTRLAVGNNSVMYVYGNEIDVIPWELAKERGLVDGDPEEYILQWRNVVLTTCTLDHPHYRLESKQVTFIPGRIVTAKKPRVYLGNTYLFTSPINFTVQLKRRAVQYSFLPFFQRTDLKGSSGGVTATAGWDTGEVSLGVSYSRKSGFEFMAEILQQINDEFSVKVGVEHSWDDVWDEKIWRPYASLMYDKNGWAVRLNWSRNEYISDRKDSLHEFKGRLDRNPEVIVYAPWYKFSTYSWMRLYASYGRYEETIYGKISEGVTSRYGMGFRNYWERPYGKVELFADSRGEVWKYDRDNADHEMLRSFMGVRYKIGAFQLGTAYERQIAWGDSPMYWDEYRDRERIHQRVRAPLGREVYAAVRGSYDLREHMVDEVVYSLQWDTDCMLWDLHYKSDRTSGGDSSIGLSVLVKAFPDRRVSFGKREEKDPFDRPLEVPKNEQEAKESRLF